MDKLRADPSDKVRQAVPGSLSDIAKDTPESVYDRIEEWLMIGSKETSQIARKAVRYGCRKGDPRATELRQEAERRIVEHKAMHPG